MGDRLSVYGGGAGLASSEAARFVQHVGARS